jgi:hypothetical protein
MITKYCAHCGTEFEAKRSNAKYCRQSCRTSASYKRNGYVYRQGHYEKPVEKKEQALSLAAPALPVQQGMNGFEAGRAKNDISMGGAVESFIGASASHIVAHQLTKGEYKVNFAKIAADQKYTLYLLQNLYKALKIPFPPGPTLTNKPKPDGKNNGLMM